MPKFDGAAADGTFSGMTFDSNGQLGVSSAVTLRPQSAGSLFRPTFTQCTFKSTSLTHPHTHTFVALRLSVCVLVCVSA